MIDQPIRDLLTHAGRPLLSFEFFPPKDDTGLENLRATCERLKPVHPDFVTVTYGAGGSTRAKTFHVCDMLAGMGLTPVMPHLTCVGSSRAELRELADTIHQRGFRNIMTLRGDPPKGDTAFRPAPDGLSHAAELVALLKERHADFCCGVAAYPEKHPEAPSPETDLVRLKEKFDAGGDFGTTQLFFDNAVYYRFVEKARAIGITQPIVPGLLPALSLKQVERMCAMCQAALPEALANRLRDAGDDPVAAEHVGIEWAIEQIRDLLARGVPGIHLYILNRSKAALSQPLLDLFGRHL
ncbi:MAG TPA: methylenetetrahydrofolate reductase [NAD(P)H] [Kiritimatiellia bacterium]|nr:methylenetetrahydrofolate reductase [NAD(P)H] [Kiritimatiellia bacterium]HMP97902.1 methylenetetrahydrofolate reductase [NAD(P)H] [Kiritimatiellia bacterium]